MILTSQCYSSALVLCSKVESVFFLPSRSIEFASLSSKLLISVTVSPADWPTRFLSTWLSTVGKSPAAHPGGCFLGFLKLINASFSFTGKLSSSAYIFPSILSFNPYCPRSISYVGIIKRAIGKKFVTLDFSKKSCSKSLFFFPFKLPSLSRNYHRVSNLTLHTSSAIFNY